MREERAANDAEFAAQTEHWGATGLSPLVILSALLAVVTLARDGPGTPARLAHRQATDVCRAILLRGRSHNQFAVFEPCLE